MADTRTGGGRTSRTRRGALAVVLALSALALSSCSWEDIWRAGLPHGVTEQSEHIENVWYIAVVAAMVVGGLTYFLILFAFFAYRRRNEDMPSQVGYHIPLEIVYTVVPLMIVIGLMYVTTVGQNAVLAEEPDPDVNVTVTGFKWNWRFTYEDTTTPAGGPVTTIGGPEVIPVLVLPTGDTVQFTVQAEDVIHSFWVPDFLFKRDAIPGRTSTFQINATEEGSYVGHCAELCGAYHAYMNFEVRTVSPAVYQEYLAARQRGLTNPEALELIGGEPFATTTTPLDVPTTNQARS